jgi:hypothetical protein
MMGRILAAAAVLVLGLGYWLWIVLQDRMRPLVSMKGGVRPDGTDCVFGDHRVSRDTKTREGKPVAACVRLRGRQRVGAWSLVARWLLLAPLPLGRNPS